MTQEWPREHLTVEVRLLPEPCLWAWEIRDAQHGEVIESSWTTQWAAYQSPEEAYSEGRRHLVRLSGGPAPRRPEAA